MIIDIPKSITVVVDTREHHPLVFPRTLDWSPGRGWPTTRIVVNTETKTVTAGDYYLREYPKACIIERKASARELLTNLLSSDRARQMRAFRKLARACAHPILMIERSLLEFQAETRRLDCHVLLDLLWEAADRFGLDVFWAGRHRLPGPRRELAGILVGRMLSYAVRVEPEK